MCSEHYKKWKKLALSAVDQKEANKCLEKAFFWLELQTAFITLSAIEQSKGNDPEVKKQLIVAKTNLSKKLADYAGKILDEIKL
jgi:hypothetical protein